MPRIHRISTATLRTEGDPSTKDPLLRQWTTGFYKEPVDGPVHVRKHGVEGDAVADTKHHGGADKAVLCYALLHYEAWNREFADLEMGPGGLAENLTITDLTESDVCIGDIYEAGECQFQVSQPRQPCWKISRRWGIKSLTKEVVKNGRTGWYVRVLCEGKLEASDEFRLISRVHPNWSVERANDILFQRETDADAVTELRELPELANAWKASL